MILSLFVQNSWTALTCWLELGACAYWLPPDIRYYYLRWSSKLLKTFDTASAYLPISHLLAFPLTYNSETSDVMSFSAARGSSEDVTDLPMIR